MRFIENDMVRSPHGDDSSAENSFGVQTRKYDVEDVQGYWVVQGLPDENPTSTLVPADEVLHVKYPETPSFSKRGLSPFFSIETNLRFAEELLTSTVSLAKNRAKIAVIRKLHNTVASAAQALLDNQADVRTTDPATANATVTLEKYRYGTVLTVPATSDYEFPDAGVGASDHVAVYQMVLRSIGARFNMPEYLISSDASNGNFASTLVAEAPFVKSIERLQDYLGYHFAGRRYGQRSVIWKQIAHSVHCGVWPPDVFALVDVQVEPPSLVVRDPLQQAQVDKIYNEMGVKSRATIQLQLDLDPKQEAAHLAAETPKVPSPADRTNLSDPSSPGVPPRGGVQREEWNERDHPRADDGRFGDKPGDHSVAPADVKPSKVNKGPKKADKPKKPRAVVGPMASARREGDVVIMADGSEPPSHVKASHVQADWTDVRISTDPDADVWVEAKTKKGRKKRVYGHSFLMKTAAFKFARTTDGLRLRQQLFDENAANRKDAATRSNADCTWLMLEQATRPGSESDNKGNRHLFDVPLTSANVEVSDRPVKEPKKPPKRPSKKPPKPPEKDVTLRVNGESILIRDKGAKDEIRRRIEAGESLEDSTYWLKSYGATTLEGRHVVIDGEKTYLRFMGKESVWHSHEIENPKLATMLRKRKEAAGEKGKLFRTNYAKVTKYAKTLDGGKFTPKDWRTQKATSMAVELVKGMDPPKSTPEYRRLVMDVGEKVSRKLGNRPAQALKSYIDPNVFAVWGDHRG